jgi:hypothetical protein
MLSFLTNGFSITTGLLVLVFIIGCEMTHPDGESTEKLLRASQGGDIRGVNIGDKPEDVRKIENAESVYSMPDELVYRIPPDSKDSTWYEISYNFDEGGLYDVKMTIYPRSDTALQTLRNNFIKYYIQKYGECKMEGGYCGWRSMTNNGHFVSITLADTVLHKSKPCLQVNFNEQ